MEVLQTRLGLKRRQNARGQHLACATEAGRSAASLACGLRSQAAADRVPARQGGSFAVMAGCLAVAVSQGVWPAAAAEEYGATLAPRKPPRAVVVPAAPGALAEALRTHPPNTTFYLLAGRHTGNGEMRPKPGTVIIGQRGAILDGEDTTPHCFVHDSRVIPYSPNAPRYVVTLRNLVICRYATPDQECAVMADSTGQGWMSVLSDPGDRSGWLVDHCTFSENRTGGLFLGSASTAQHVLARRNGQVGFKATGRGARFIACRSTENNADCRVNYFWEAGGMKCWNVKDLLVEGGEYDSNGGIGIWLDYTWDGNVIRRVYCHDNRRAGISIEMTAGALIQECTLSRDDIDGLSGAIPAAWRPWDQSPRSGPDLWQGEIFIFNGSGSGTFVHPATKQEYRFNGQTRIERNRIRDGGGGILCLYQDRGSIDALGAQMQGSRNGPVAGILGVVVAGNDIECTRGYAAAVNVLAHRDYRDASGSFGPVPMDQVRAQFEGVVYRNNRYRGNPRFCVPKAAATGQGTSVWDWMARADVDLGRWQALGKR